MNRLFRCSGFAAALLLTACAANRPPTTPRLDDDLFHTIVFRYRGAETGRLAEKPRVDAFIARLNTGVADSGGAVSSPCRISLLGREGAQTMRAQGNRISLSGAGCRFGQAHCRYRVDFDVEALCKAGGNSTSH